ncbi:hypothetical protein MU580_02180 [Clavibacter michiganensis subsp. michiganensis]|uniref:hypothetical protein n=1 Tax=Clavibacter michiganensis TaxID=28447 RepID=UPI001FF4A759|nr:hypothetical protein [Clavibacter michiganensis]UOW04105.1 hypothetical protein MU580_02180 [Clavibacter michiganensis subsp. michiganensis]
MEYALTPIVMRLNHATELINEFRRQEAAFRKDAHLEMKEEYNSTTRVLTAVIGGDIPPREMGLLLGDILHSIRAALDNLIVVMLEKERAPILVAHQFPMLATNNSRSRKSLSSSIAGVGLAERRLVEKYQPYTWDDQASLHPLNKLRVFSNADKHRVLLPSGMAYDWYLEEDGKVTYLTPVVQTAREREGKLEFTITVNGVQNAEIDGDLRFYVDDPSRFWEATLKNVHGEPHFTYSSAPQVSVGFKYEGLQVTHPVLLQIHKCAQDMVNEVAIAWGYTVTNIQSEL